MRVLFVIGDLLKFAAEVINHDHRSAKSAYLCELLYVFCCDEEMPEGVLNIRIAAEFLIHSFHFSTVYMKGNPKE